MNRRDRKDKRRKNNDRPGEAARFVILTNNRQSNPQTSPQPSPVTVLSSPSSSSTTRLAPSGTLTSSPQIAAPIILTNDRPIQSASPSAIQLIQSSHSADISIIKPDLIDNKPDVMKLIDPDVLSFVEHPAADYLYNESQSLGGYNVIGAVGQQCVGKSSLLNRIAGRNVFKTHVDVGEIMLKHVTRGMDLHVTPERLLLLDTQPILSASVLDEYIKVNLPSSLSTEISEAENFSYITSIQFVSFLLAVCDYIVVTSDWMTDLHLIKLISTAIMMVGPNSQRAEIVWYLTKRNRFEDNKDAIYVVESLLGRGSVTVIDGDFDALMCHVMKSRSNSTGRNPFNTSEKSWLLSAQKQWDNIRKSTLYSDYVRFLP